MSPADVSALSREQVFAKLLKLEGPFPDWTVGPPERRYLLRHGPDPLGWLEEWRMEDQEHRSWLIGVSAGEDTVLAQLYETHSASVDDWRAEHAEHTLACAIALLAAKLAQGDGA